MTRLATGLVVRNNPRERHTGKTAKPGGRTIFKPPARPQWSSSGAGAEARNRAVSVLHLHLVRNLSGIVPSASACLWLFDGPCPIRTLVGASGHVSLPRSPSLAFIISGSLRKPRVPGAIADTIAGAVPRSGGPHPSMTVPLRRGQPRCRELFCLAGAQESSVRQCATDRQGHLATKRTERGDRQVRARVPWHASRSVRSGN